MNIRVSKLRWTASAIALAAFWGTGADTVLAQATEGAQSTMLETITVTARKREESLMEVPLSITAVTATELQAAGIKDANELAAYTPGLFIEYSERGQNTRTVVFRGNSADPGLIFIDGAPYAGGANPDLGSLERVEVLVGPQSAYFGRSTFTGAINYVTKDPGDTFSGRASAEYSSFGSTDDSISVDLPVVRDKLSIRVNGHHTLQGGEWLNGSNSSEMLGAMQKDSLSGIIVYRPNDALKFKAYLGYVLDQDGQSPAIQLSAFNYRNVAGQQFKSRQLYCDQGGTFGPYWCGALPSAKALPGMDVPGLAKIISLNTTISPYIYDIIFNNSLKLSPVPFDPKWLGNNTLKAETKSAHLNVDYTTQNDWTFNSVTALHQTKTEIFYRPNFRDNQGVPNPLYRGAATPTILPYIGYHLLVAGVVYDGSQEFRITSSQKERLRGTLGANYFSVRNTGSTNYGQLPSGAGASGSISRSVSTTPAVFGGLYYDLMENFTVSAEMRYQWDKISSTAKFPTAGATLESTFKSFSPRLSLDYTVAKDQLLYGLWSRGYKPGGFNGSITTLSPAAIAQLGGLAVGLTFKQEKLDNYEVGLKSTWLGGRIRTTIDAYYDLWRDGQVSNNISIVSNGVNATVSVTQNVGAVDMYGVEFAGAAQITDHLTISANYNYLSSKIKTYVFLPNGPRLISACIPSNGAACVIGNKFPNAPTGSTFAISPTYTDHLAGDWEWYVRGDWKHRGRYYIDATNIAWIPSSDTIDLHLGIKTDKITVEGYVKNLTNQQEFSNGATGTDSTCCTSPSNINAIRLVLPHKRSFGIRGSYNF